MISEGGRHWFKGSIHMWRLHNFHICTLFLSMTQSSMLFPLYRDSIIDAHKVWWNLLLLLLDWYALPCWVVLNYVFIPYYLGHHIWMVPNFVNIFGHLLSFLPPPPFLRNGKSTPWCLVAGSHLQVRFFTQRRRTFLPLRHDFQIRRLLLQIGSGKQAREATWKCELQGWSKTYKIFHWCQSIPGPHCWINMLSELNSLSQ